MKHVCCEALKAGMVLSSFNGFWLVLHVERVTSFEEERYEDAVQETWLVNPFGDVTNLVLRGYEKVTVVE